MANYTSLILTEKWLKTDLLVTLNILITLVKMEQLMKTVFLRLASITITLVSMVNFIGKLLSTTKERPITQIGMALSI